MATNVDGIPIRAGPEVDPDLGTGAEGDTANPEPITAGTLMRMMQQMLQMMQMQQATESTGAGAKSPEKRLMEKLEKDGEHGRMRLQVPPVSFLGFRKTIFIIILNKSGLYVFGKIK